MDTQTSQQQKSTEVIPSSEDLLRRDKLFITVKSPDGTIFSGEGVALSSLNDVGPFDVLPRHENFISILKTRIVVFKEKNQKEELQIEKGIIKARENKVQVFLGIETLGKPQKQIFSNNQVAQTAEAIEQEAGKK